MKNILFLLLIISTSVSGQMRKHRGAFKLELVTPVTYATLNPAAKSAGVTLSEGDLRASSTSGGVIATISMDATDKFQCEVTIITVGWHQLGIVKSGWNYTDNLGGNTNSAAMWQDDGNVEYNSSSVGNNGGSSATEIIGMTFDGTTNTLSYYRNGSLLGTTVSGFSGTFYFAYNGGGSASDVRFNFGGTAFTYPVGGFTGVSN